MSEPSSRKPKASAPISKMSSKDLNTPTEGILYGGNGTSGDEALVNQEDVKTRMDQAGEELDKSETE
ncbi:hypothetical protein MJA45_21165 [Paenibacillus aurantius]|uniref:Uncharacterized protein n=1 Tax=Paenibacillus aurantius TaxID=2918900 RepID=A0AA96LEG1_9BACL|nr:hypothetical protein [Paenibacillus aurantius]WJH34879.1 hypothetical protein N6H14_01515 [Paenibacillus sp. CC-CFT747]WNQ10112.1 hypothetical protein MJA45_21165 [Paenibacillus aurantius]